MTDKRFGCNNGGAKEKFAQTIFARLHPSKSMVQGDWPGRRDHLPSWAARFRPIHAADANDDWAGMVAKTTPAPAVSAPGQYRADAGRRSGDHPDHFWAIPDC